jgi:hypothetical protein
MINDIYFVILHRNSQIEVFYDEIFEIFPVVGCIFLCR